MQPSSDKTAASRWSDDDGNSGQRTPLASLAARPSKQSTLSLRSTASTFSTHTAARSPGRAPRPIPAPDPIITIPDATSLTDAHDPASREPAADDDGADDDYVTVEHPGPDAAALVPRPDKAARVLGIRHRAEMEPIPASNRTSLASAVAAPPPAHAPSLPLASLYVVSGLPKSAHTWTLADPDSVMGLHHSEGAVARWWRPEVLGSTLSPGAGGSGGKRKKKGRADDASTVFSASGHLSKQEIGKMLSKSLKLSFPREVEIVASTLQPASTVHTFTFTLPAGATPLASSPSTDVLRASVLSDPGSSSLVSFADDPFARARPSSALLGPSPGFAQKAAGGGGAPAPTVTYHGVCLTVWSHADAERTAAIRRTLEAGRARKESAQSAVTARQARRRARMGARGPWSAGGGGAGTDVDTDVDGETDGEGGAVSESDFDGASVVGHTPGESTLFLPGDTVFWLPYALTLVSRFPIYDLMRDYLTLSWARFSKDVQSHTLQIGKILAHPAPRPGELVRLDASAAAGTHAETALEVVARFPGGLDFGRGLVDVNFTMWPLFKCLNIDNILTVCEIALAPTGRVLFYSRHPAMLGIAVHTIKYLVELRGWSGVALATVHSRDAKIYVEDPGPWIIGLATEARYCVRAPPEVCVVDLDINYLNCAAPPPGVVSTKQQRERYRQRLLAAFEPHYHPDHSVPSEFKEAFPAGRFRPVCKIQAKRGAASTAVADMVKPPEWWHSTRIIQAFDSVLADKMKKPSLLKRISSFGTVRAPPRLTEAEQHIQLSIRKRATAFVDARDDLETKIGRLSRRLNFLMSESDLWRDKFVTFEQYAEKLSVEASELRTKIGKEQRETKRLSSMISMTAAEKAKLQNKLFETEDAHKKALMELEQMRLAMEKMEEERAEMIAEVEAQIERALVHIAVDVDDSEYGSRPSSRMSTRSAPSTFRRPSERPRTLGSFSTDSTLAESLDALDALEPRVRTTGTVPEEDEDEDGALPMHKKRFSANVVGIAQDMSAMDEGISQKSDRITQKVLQIQRKLESALAAEAQRRSYESTTMSESEMSESARTHRSRKARGSRAPGKHARRSSKRNLMATPPPRSSNSLDSMVDTTPAPVPEEQESVETCVVDVQTASPKQSLELPALRQCPTSTTLSASPSEITPITPSLSVSTSVTTDDEDADFQSAYSMSPRNSYGDHFEERPGKAHRADDSEHGTPTIAEKIAGEAWKGQALKVRERASSTSTATETKVRLGTPTSIETVVTSPPAVLGSP